MEDIFSLSVSKKQTEFVEKASLLEVDVASDIIDVLVDFPWLGDLIKLGRVGKGIIDLLFVKRLGLLLQQSEYIEDEKKEQFLSKLKPKDRKRMYEYLVHLLYTADEDRKAILMGMVYRDRILNKIDDDMFLRLCCAINKVYVADIDKLKNYVNTNYTSDYVANNLYSSGLLQLTESKVVDGTFIVGGNFIINKVGAELLRITNENNDSTK